MYPKEWMGLGKGEEGMYVYTYKLSNQESSNWQSIKCEVSITLKKLNYLKR